MNRRAQGGAALFGLLVCAAACAASLPEPLLTEIGVAHEGYDLPRFYAASRRFLDQHPQHEDAPKVRYDLALQLVTENLQTPASAEAAEARDLLKTQMQLAKRVDDRFAAALLQLKFAPHDVQPGLTRRLLEDFADYSAVDQVYFFAIHNATAKGDLAGAVELAKAFSRRWPDAEETPRYRRLVTRQESVGRRFELPGVDASWVAQKVVLVDFWATWCDPCIAELPRLRRFNEANGPRGFAVVGVSIDDDAAALASFVSKEQLPWPVIRVGSASGGFADGAGVDDIPRYFLLDRAGRVVDTELSGLELYARIEAMLGRQAEVPAPASERRGSAQQPIGPRDAAHSDSRPPG